MSNYIHSKIMELIHANELDGLLLFGPDNQTYATGMVLPFANQAPERHSVLLIQADGSQVYILPKEWDQAITDQLWAEAIITYNENQGVPPGPFVNALKDVLEKSNLSASRVGFDAYQIDASVIKKIKKHHPEITLTAMDQDMTRLRIVKTTEEIDLIEQAGIQADKGLIGAINHLEGAVDGPGYTIAELIERVRVHIIEHGGTGIGHLSAVQSKKAQHFYLPPKGRVKNTGLLRINYTNSQNGYWFNAARMLSIGEPIESQVKAKKDNQMLKDLAITLLKPGVTCSEIFNKVKQCAVENAIEFISENGAGHGMGASEVEAPFLTADDPTELEEGMVIGLDIVTRGPHGEMIHSRDAYAITGNGNRLLSWYKNWDELYIIRGFRSTH